MKAKTGNDQPLQVEKDESTMQASDNSNSDHHQHSGMAHARTLDNLRDPNWKAQLEEFLKACRRTGSKGLARVASEDTLSQRADILNRTFELIIKDKNLKTLADIKPGHTPRMLELLEQAGVGARARINYFINVRWFFRMCGIEMSSNAPVGSRAHANDKLLWDARQKITEAIGHHRKALTSAYYGSFRNQTN